MEGVLLEVYTAFLPMPRQNWPHLQSQLPGNILPGCSAASAHP